MSVLNIICGIEHTKDTDKQTITKYLTNSFNINYEQDYEDISHSGTFETSINSDILQNDKINIKTGINKKEWSELSLVLSGTVNDVKYTQNKATYGVESYTQNLEKTGERFEYTDTKMTVILSDMIKKAGLKPVFHLDGLEDKIIDYSNVNKETDTNSNVSTSKEVKAFATEIVGDKTDDKEVAQAIHTGILNRVSYKYYENHRYCPNKVLSQGWANCCDVARLGYHCASAVGLEARGIHGTNHVWVEYSVNGKWIASDPTSHSRLKIGEVWKGMKGKSIWTFPKCG